MSDNECCYYATEVLALMGLAIGLMLSRPIIPEAFPVGAAIGITTFVVGVVLIPRKQ